MYRLHHWFRWSHKTGAPAKRRARLTPRIEILEDRCVPSFMSTTYPTADGNQANAVAVGDLTGNGVSDLVLSQGLFTVGVYLGNGDGTFRPAGSYGTGGVAGIQIADLRGNGIPDIVMSGGVDGVSVLLGNGDGTFKPRHDYLAGAGAFGLVVTDLTGNGILDIATANYYDGTVSVLLGNGDGTFQPATTYAVGRGPFRIAAGSFGSDSGLPDLAVVDSLSNTVSVLLNSGDGTFRRHVDYGVGSSPGAIALGDFAQTGTLDIAVANLVSNSVSLLRGNGDGTFQPARNIAVPQSLNVNGLVAADFNSDGNLDLAVMTRSGPNYQVSVLLGDGTGNFAPPVNFPTGNDPVRIVAADLTNDGNADLVTPNSFSRSYTVLLNDGMWDTAPQGPRGFGNAVAGSVPDPTLAGVLVSSGSPARSPAGVGVAGLPKQSVRSDSTPPADIAGTAWSEDGSRQALPLFPLTSAALGSAEAPDLRDSAVGIIDQPWIDLGLADEALHARR